jgi:pyruvate,water dikinase
LLLSDGRAFYEGLNDAPPGADENVIVGSPVSPGVVEGAVRVVFDPNAAQLAPGEILVCPGTDPSWTPLFLAAGGLVMEVGGMMTPGGRLGRRARIRYPDGGRRGSGHAPPANRPTHPRGWSVRADCDIG